MIAVHKATRARLTIACQEVDPKDISRFGIMTVNREDEILSFEENQRLQNLILHLWVSICLI